MAAFGQAAPRRVLPEGGSAATLRRAPARISRAARIRRAEPACRAARGALRVCCAIAGSPAELSAAQLAPRTKRLLDALSPEEGTQAGGAGGSTTWAALLRADASWLALRSGTAPSPPPFVHRAAGNCLSVDALFDVVVCGGTLGVLFASALAQRGLSVAVVERGELRGREQDWNISRHELNSLVTAGALSADEVESCITAEFNPGRCAFHAAREAVLVSDVLNLGVSPARIVAAARTRLESAATPGTVFERTAVDSVTVYDDCVQLNVPSGASIRGRILLDCMGHASPIVRQARVERPDGVCLVVGSCASGFARNTSGDVIVTDTDMEGEELRQQLFWEAFPAGSGPSHRTTYMFTYADADPGRPSLTAMLERYWPLLERYQGVDLERDGIQMLRVLFGCFPTYRHSPLQLPFDRLLAVGDASGIQSPLSFGGFGALCRHLGRVCDGVSDALQADCCDRASLARLNPYLPNLSGAWLFQRAMSAPRGTRPARNFVNTLLGTNFGVMQRLGDATLRPFLQDVPTFAGLTTTLTGMMLSKPTLIPPILLHCGPGPVLDWLRHFLMMGLYTLLFLASKPLRGQLRLLPPRARFHLARWIEAFEYGSGMDYQLPR